MDCHIELQLVPSTPRGSHELWSSMELLLPSFAPSLSPLTFSVRGGDEALKAKAQESDSLGSSDI